MAWGLPASCGAMPCCEESICVLPYNMPLILRLSSCLQPLGSLHLLASENDVPALAFLLENGADINQRDDEGCTALHWAADRGSLQVNTCLHAQPLCV